MASRLGLARGEAGAEERVGRVGQRWRQRTRRAGAQPNQQGHQENEELGREARELERFREAELGEPRRDISRDLGMCHSF